MSGEVGPVVRSEQMQDMERGYPTAIHPNALLQLDSDYLGYPFIVLSTVH